MSDRIVKVLIRNSVAKLRVLVVQRTDGVYTYYRQWASPEGWAGDVPCGLYDTAETAESEARARVWWLANSN
jgi:hypothetical protein